MNITVMQNYKANLPVSGGELERENNHYQSLFQMKEIKNYSTPDYCLSCAYFQQTKGNFGRCTVLKNDKKFDGSKKGSACNCWRLESSLIQIVSISKPQKVLSEFELKVKKHNEIMKTKQQVNGIKKQSIKQNTNQTDFLYHLPYGQTSDIKPKRKIYGTKTPYKIIKYAVELMKNESLSAPDIVRDIQRNFGYSVARSSIARWAKIYLPNKRWWVRSGSHRIEVQQKISNGVIHHYQGRKASQKLSEVAEN